MKTYVPHVLDRRLDNEVYDRRVSRGDQQLYESWVNHVGGWYQLYPITQTRSRERVCVRLKLNVLMQVSR